MTVSSHPHVNSHVERVGAQSTTPVCQQRFHGLMISDVSYNTYSDKDIDITETSTTFKRFLSRACFILRVIKLLYVLIVEPIGLRYLSRVFAIVHAIAIRILSVVCCVHQFVFTCESTCCIYVYTPFPIPLRNYFDHFLISELIISRPCPHNYPKLVNFVAF